ncbi:hypothetical protein EMIT0194MI4_10315 [Pseudomonas sp. IT-194MI4]
MRTGAKKVLRKDSWLNATVGYRLCVVESHCGALQVKKKQSTPVISDSRPTRSPPLTSKGLR